MLSAVMEDYIKAIYVHEEDGDGRVSTSALADDLEVTAPTVSATLKTLEERDLIDRKEYKGVTLTEEGELVALEVLRHHRILETFLTERFDYDWADVHREADRLEHYVSEELTDRIAETLGNPPVDPHGDPIPDADLSVPEGRETIRLAEAEEDEHVTVHRIHDQDDADLRYLADVGIRPAVELAVVRVAPFGMITVETPAGEQSLPTEIARLIEVVPAAAADGTET
ncbi:metal-dependent transcriptional regulator [Halovivax limisalsi]|uniref:metal-dependent transcriptional regulator n=1 Tax=Halovivax limisalsi TaxID=1453760 RepID=UPI001FFCA6A7|nr:metal-dependent transcriptional regulator [Halovivax limisalsi]